ncbi:MAG: hypothetical protein SVR04_00055 [Spirochaetota bacterium]|jgi:hypothetical protein|nr:hypothetical protein [Spirochaetota bacterium]
MKRDYIEKLYRAGQDADARRAIRQEIIRENTPEDQDPTYEPTEAEIDAVEVQYYSSRRAYRYGPPERQVEYITEHGIEAWQTRVSETKAQYPKPWKE